MQRETSVTAIKGVGDEVAKKLASLGIRTVGDLIDYYPRKYEDYSEVTKIKDLLPGTVTLEAIIEKAQGRYVRRGMHITEAVATDDGEHRVRMTWFNQPYREKAFKLGQKYFISGNYELKRGRFSIANPSIELVSDFPVSTARIVPIYRETKGMTSVQLRKYISNALPYIRSVQETLPDWLIEQNDLMPRASALEMIHFPEDSRGLATAKRRLGFEEVFELSLAALLTKYEMLKDVALPIPFNETLAKQFVGHLPFQLTDAQRKVVWQLYQDMQKSSPMNRLVEGDVGSGKTVVATMAAMMVLAEGYQVAFMAPTELLARQHGETVYRLLEAVGMHDRVALLVGGMPAKQKEQAYSHIASGEAGITIGTHALIQEKVDMRRLGLVVVDEQHRFGVDQRKKLLGKVGHMPHLLSLTATPIPRSLALTLYGELDVSIINMKPAGRLPIKTEICSPNSRAQLYVEIDKQLEAGRQMFVVCPLISAESENNIAQGKKLLSAETVFNDLSKKDFKHRRVGLLHGKMKPQEKQDIMDGFVRHELDILVSTTVIEVGVDVPNATVMLIEAADRFGLAQIHQLRGRVGRGKDQGYCYLMMSDSSQPPRRLQALERSNDGFKLAELDLELRGPGAIYGTMQHGALDLRIAKLSDVELIADARHAAGEFIDKGENLVQYTELHKRVVAARSVTNLN